MEMGQTDIIVYGVTISLTNSTVPSLTISLSLSARSSLDSLLPGACAASLHYKCFDKDVATRLRAWPEEGAEERRLQDQHGREECSGG